MGWDRWARPVQAVLAVAALCAALAGCGGGNSNSVSTRISGVVQDRQTNAPIVGATVQVGGTSVLTNSTGVFNLGVPAGKLSVTVSASHYQTQTFSAVADPGTNNDIGVLTLLNADTNPPTPPV
jgi:hypothetical protein